MDDDPQRWAGLIADAATRHGAFHLRRADRFDLTRNEVRGRARREGWAQPHPAIFFLPGSVDSWHRTTAGRLELFERDAALGLRSAGHLHGFVRQAPALTEVVRPHGAHRAHANLVATHLTRRWDEAELEVVSGLVVTAPAATLRHLAAVLDVTPLRALVIDGFHAGALSDEVVELAVDAMPPGPPRRRLAQVKADIARVVTDSPFAYEVLEALQRVGIPIEGEFPWRCPDGRIIHFDGALPHSWVALECDGRGKYSAGTSFTTDRKRWTQASGRWRQVWTDWGRWRGDRRGVLADVVRAVAEADPRRPTAERADCNCHRCRRFR